MVKDGHMAYRTSDVCAKEVQFDVVNGIIHNVIFDGGCRGNTQGVAVLAEGMRIEDVPTRLRGIDCHGGHSCPDEFAKAVEQYLRENQ